VSVPHTGTRTITECSVKFGCSSTTETYTYYTTETYSYTVTRTYTYTVTRTATYWATSSFDSSHKFTGRTRHKVIEDAVYGTEYEVERETQYTETVTRYQVSRDELVKPAQYEWRREQTTNDSMLAHRQASSNEDWRIGKSITDTTWVLTRRNGTVRFETSQYANESRVVETSATVDGDLVEKYHNVETNEKVTKTSEERSKRYTADGAKERWEILEDVTDSGGDGDECRLKDLC
jgi:hypothetical protein